MKVKEFFLRGQTSIILSIYFIGNGVHYKRTLVQLCLFNAFFLHYICTIIGVVIFHGNVIQLQIFGQRNIIIVITFIIALQICCINIGFNFSFAVLRDLYTYISLPYTTFYIQHRDWDHCKITNVFHINKNQ